jgi:hypothetical protein
VSEWIKASASGDQGACVEVRLTDTCVDVRDTKDRTRAPFTVQPSAWDAFLAGVRRREFDHGH